MRTKTKQDRERKLIIMTTVKKQVKRWVEEELGENRIRVPEDKVRKKLSWWGWGEDVIEEIINAMVLDKWVLEHPSLVVNELRTSYTFLRVYPINL